MRSQSTSILPEVRRSHSSSRIPELSAIATEYTEDGRIKAEFDSENNRTEYKYDAIGRQIEVKSDENNYVRYTYDTAGNRRTETYYAEGTSWSNTYDELGRVIAFTDPNNNITRSEYNESGQLTAVIDPLGGKTAYEYDENGQLTQVTDALGQVTKYEYKDAQNRLTAVILPDGVRSTTAYNDEENSVTVTDFNGDGIKYIYDESGSLQQKDLLASGTSVSYGFDETTRTETITSDHGTTVYQYNELGQLISRTDPDGTSLEYTYEDGYLTGVKTPNREIGYGYDEEGNLASVTTDEGTTVYEYENGQLVKTIFPNNTAEIITYDELGRIDVIETVKVDSDTGETLSVLASFDYEVDAVGNREKVTDREGRVVEYKYDELNRVIEEKITHPVDGERTIDYEYDEVGNLEYKRDTLKGDTDFVYNSLNQLVSSTFAGVETLYTYDDNGSLKTRKTGEKTITYNWENDGENRLVGVDIVEGNETTDIDYEYNENGIRVGKTVNGVETSYLVDELRPYAQVLEEYDAQGNPISTYTYGLDLISRDGQFYHVDGLGSTRLLSDENGEVLESYDYDAYGNLIGTEVGDTSHLFAGEQRDNLTGLDYLRARYYDPTLGRFISRDAYQGSLNDPMSQHKYQYAHANPVVNTDPSGYVTLGEKVAAFALNSILAATSYTVGYGIGAGIRAGSINNTLTIYNQYLAGFSDSITFGASTWLRTQWYGESATQDHRGIFFNLGRFSGTLGGAILGGFAAPAQLSQIGWGVRVAQGYSTTGTAVGVAQSTKNLLEGRFTPWDLLPFIPLVGFAGGVAWRKFFQPNSIGPLDDYLAQGSKGGLRRIVGAERLNYFRKNSKIYYSVQNSDDAVRLANGGAPWPVEPTRAHLGPGLYSWGTRSDAERYLSRLRNRDVNVNILSFRISEGNLKVLKKLDLTALPTNQADDWVNLHSSIYGSGVPHNYEYVIRSTGSYGAEHYFAKNVFQLFRQR